MDELKTTRPVDLLPCPFCGGNAKLMHGKPNQQKAGMRVAFVLCLKCKSKSRTFVQQQYEAWRDVDRFAVECWNRRPDNEEG